MEFTLKSVKELPEYKSSGASQKIIKQFLESKMDVALVENAKPSLAGYINRLAELKKLKIKALVRNKKVYLTRT